MTPRPSPYIKLERSLLDLQAAQRTALRFTHSSLRSVRRRMKEEGVESLSDPQTPGQIDLLDGTVTPPPATPSLTRAERIAARRREDRVKQLLAAPPDPGLDGIDLRAVDPSTALLLITRRLGDAATAVQRHDITAFRDALNSLTRLSLDLSTINWAPANIETLADTGT